MRRSSGSRMDGGARPLHRSIARGLLVLLVMELLAPAARAFDDRLAEARADAALLQGLNGQLAQALARVEDARQQVRAWEAHAGGSAPVGLDPVAWRAEASAGLVRARSALAEQEAYLERLSGRVSSQRARMAAILQTLTESGQGHEATLLTQAVAGAHVAEQLQVGAAPAASGAAPGGALASASAGEAASLGSQVGAANQQLFQRASRVYQQQPGRYGSVEQVILQARSGSTSWGMGQVRRADNLMTSLRAQQGKEAISFGGATEASAARASVSEVARAPASYKEWIAVPRGSRNDFGHYELQQVTRVRGADGTFHTEGRPLERVALKDLPVRTLDARGKFVTNDDTGVLARARAAERSAREGFVREARSQASKSSKHREIAREYARRGKEATRASRNAEGEKASVEAGAEASQLTAGARAKAFVKGAAQWAALSVAMDVAIRAFESMDERGRPDWKYATRQLFEARYWGGVGGSALLGTAALQLLSGGLAAAGPLGQVARLGLVFGAGAVGWHWGSGNLENVDWTHLGVTTLAAALGATLGLAMGGPLGSMVGGMAGSWIADRLLSALREAGGPSLMAYQRAPRSLPHGVAPGAPPSPVPDQAWAGGAPSKGAVPVRTSLPDPVELAREQSMAYQEFLAAEERLDRAGAQAAYQRYVVARGTLERHRFAQD